LGQQLRCPVGELDLVVREGQVLVFVEVRYRRSRYFGGATASITRAKQERMLKAIDWWLPKLVRTAFGGQMPLCRIDLATFDQDELTWHRDALRLNPDK
jgi:putative endonuclease